MALLLYFLASFCRIDELQDLAHRLYLQAAQAADKCEAEGIAYEFMTRALSLYEDMAKSDLQSKALDQVHKESHTLVHLWGCFNRLFRLGYIFFLTPFF